VVETATPDSRSYPPRASSAFKPTAPVPKPSTPVCRQIRTPGPPTYTMRSSQDPGLQDPLGDKAGPQTVISYHSNLPTHNQAGKFHKVAPPQNFWGGSSDSWKRRVRQGNPPILPLAIPGPSQTTPGPYTHLPPNTPIYNPNGNQPPDPSPFQVISEGPPQPSPRKTGGPPDVGVGGPYGGSDGGGSPGGGGFSDGMGSPGSSHSSSYTRQRSRNIPKARTALGDRVN